MTRKIVIVGATSSIAEHCARQWVAHGPCELLLVGRDAARTERVAADLRVRAPTCRVEVATTRFDNVDAIIQLAQTACTPRVPDIVLIAHGSLPDQQQCQQDIALANEALNVNAVSPVLYAEAFASHLEKAGRGTIALIGSVAGDRGRKSNYVYGAAKGLVTRYAQGLQHRFATTAAKIVLIKPGPTDTPMTAHLKSSGAKMARVESVARTIVDGIDKGTPVIYAPAKWALIMLVIQHLPRFLFSKMDI